MSEIQRVRVRCTVFVTVDLPADADPFFEIEENSCPLTGAVGAALRKFIDDQDDAGVCQSCAEGWVNNVDNVERVQV